MNNISEVISIAVEGIVDEAVVRRLLEHVGAKLGRVYGKNGKQNLLKQLPGYNQAARHHPWLVMVDLDHDADCAPPFRARWPPSTSPKMCFR